MPIKLAGVLELRCGNGRRQRQGRAEALKFIVEEEEGLVLDDGSTNGVAELVVCRGGDGGTLYAINQTADNNLVSLRFRLKNSAGFEVAEEPFEVAGQKFNRGSFLVRMREKARWQPKPLPEEKTPTEIKPPTEA